MSLSFVLLVVGFGGFFD